MEEWYILPSGGAWGSGCQGALVRLSLLRHIRNRRADRSAVSSDCVNRLPVALRGSVVRATLGSGLEPHGGRAGVGGPLSLLTACLPLAPRMCASTPAACPSACGRRSPSLSTSPSTSLTS